MKKIIPVYGALVMYEAANLQTVKQEFSHSHFTSEETQTQNKKERRKRRWSRGKKRR